MKKIAVILFNLGGPSDPQAIQPFLFNLFNDPAIIRLPQPLRFLIARLISKKREPVARGIYEKMGGGSPILQNTQAQANALEKTLNANSENLEYKCFIAMRYWHPFARDKVQIVKNYAPDEIILLPLYPQFSTTTTDSSIKDWRQAAQKINLDVPTKIVCCYPRQNGFINALAASIREAYSDAFLKGKPRILFSAHGLPEKIIKAGDPYQAQCQMTVDALRNALDIPDLDSVLCFQSRVGPMKWIGPSTDDEVRRAGQEKIPLVVVPIAFVSDHSETLVELHIEYRELARACGVSFYKFVSPVGTAPDFIEGLAEVTRNARAQKKTCLPEGGARLCPPDLNGCICQN